MRGQVQGVGFRPFVWSLANGMGLRGQVLNDSEGVLIFAAGKDADQLPIRIKAEAPPLSHVTGIEVLPQSYETLSDSFVIAATIGQGTHTGIAPDAATCRDCLAELRDPKDRRFGYPFANCTNCGPRFTIIERMPYDRAQTTMAAFQMCTECAAEYENPMDRRFHAQPIACPVCGPRLWLEVDQVEQDVDPITAASEMLCAGQILAVKGLGGFHLVCDATNPATLAKLRDRKRRPTKPFALMGRLAMIRMHSTVSADEEQLLTDPAAPIVLLESQRHELSEAIAPQLQELGWMLPYTPLHHLLLDACDRPLVLTSGNLSGEPQVIGNAEAREKLNPFVDGFLMHDRGIARRLDDSVERADPPMILRRARGRVPTTLNLPKGFADAPQIAAYGGQMKGALCLIKDGQALLGHHLGDLGDALSYDAFLQADRDYADLFDHDPEMVACDLHPEFGTTRHAQSKGLPVVRVQHHHAHMAACMGENAWPLDGGKVAGLILDGLGLGPDDTVWGGEVLLGDYRGFERIACLTPAPLIGGDRAQSEPWRNALARLDAAELSEWADELFSNAPRDLARQAAAAGINAPQSSSAGRLFDAVAACLGICPMGLSYEGEAAIRLETLARLASRQEIADAYPLNIANSYVDPAQIWPLIRHDLAEGTSAETIALRFHAGLAQAVSKPARALVECGDAQAVVLSGGCFQNVLLLELTLGALDGVPVLTHRKVPANDGGLALGQALVAAALTVGTG